MKIAITSQNKRTITDHPGRCRRFFIYDVEGKNIQGRWLLELDKDKAFHDASANAPHPLDDVDVLISARMADWLEQRLAARNTEALATSETDPDQAVHAYLNGTLKRLPVMKHPHSKGLQEIAANQKQFSSMPEITINRG